MKLTQPPPGQSDAPKKGRHITALLTDSTCPERESLEEHSPQPLLVIGEIPPLVSNHCAVIRYSTS